MGAREIKYLCCQQAGERENRPQSKIRIFVSYSLFAERQYTDKPVKNLDERDCINRV
jgi:hypothetical protein